MKDNTRVEQGQNGEQRRIRNYSLVGIIVFAALLLVAIVATALIFAFDTSATSPQLNAAFFGLVFVCFVLAVGLLYVLFTLRSTLRTVREQAAQLALLRAGTAAPPSAPAPYTAPAPVEYENRDVVLIEGIGPVLSRRLAREGIRTIQDLRTEPAERIAEAADVSVQVATRWKTMADLLVVPEIDHQAAEILVASGIGSVRELARQNVDTLGRRLVRTNHEGENRIVPNAISRDMVQAWIQGAQAATRTTPGNGRRRGERKTNRRARTA